MSRPRLSSHAVERASEMGLTFSDIDEAWETVDVTYSGTAYCGEPRTTHKSTETKLSFVTDDPPTVIITVLHNEIEEWTR